MPKQPYKIDRFEGGLNRVADPRDINDNELSFTWNVNVDEIGVIKIGGGQSIPNHGPRLSANNDDGNYDEIAQDIAINDIRAVYGLFHFSADYDLSNTLQETDFTVLAQSGGVIDITEQISDGSELPNLNSDFIPLDEYKDNGINSPTIQYYVADGGLRCYNSNFDNNASITNKALIRIQRDMFTGSEILGADNNFYPLKNHNVHYDDDFRLNEWHDAKATLIPTPNNEVGNKFFCRGKHIDDLTVLNFVDYYGAGQYAGAGNKVAF